MPLSNTLLVAIMFSTVVGLSLGGLLMGLSGVVVRDMRVAAGARFLIWSVLLLVIHLSLFWDTSAITRFEDWEFPGFLLVVLGPVLLLVSTQLLTAGLESAGTEELDSHYERAARRFHWGLASVCGWIVLASVVINGEMVAAGWRFGILAAVSMACAAIVPPKHHSWVGLLAWGVLLTSLIVD